MKVSEVMTSDLETITPDQDIQAAAQLMLRADTGVIPVLEGEELAGMLTDRDIAVRAVAEGRSPDTPVREVMSGGVLFVYDDQDVEEAAMLMSDEQVRRLAVKSREGDKLVGVLSLGDIDRSDNAAAVEVAHDGITDPGGQHNQSQEG